MDAPLPTGKLPESLLRSLLAEAPPLPADVRLGPAVGEDACAIDVEAGSLVVATDPITLTGSGVGAHAVTINANDVAVMGVRPLWFLAAVLLPRGTCEADVRALFAEMRTALDAQGVVLVGGHTEVTDAVRQPIVVGQMLGHAARGAIVSTAGVRVGDVVMQIGPAPIEAAAVLARHVAQEASGIDPRTLERAKRAIESPGISVVEPALRATALGATALHDPTEGGLATGLHELADAAGVAIRLDPEAVDWFEPGVEVCRALGADPWGALASGALLASFPPDRIEVVTEALPHARLIGLARPGTGVQLGSDRLPRFARDEVARVLG